jgi:hypothetical protein
MNFSERVRAAADAERQRRYEAARTRAELAEATRQKEVARLETELSKEAIEKGKEAEGAELVEESERRSDKQDLDELQVQDEEKSPKAVITLSPNGLLSRKRKRSSKSSEGRVGHLLMLDSFGKFIYGSVHRFGDRTTSNKERRTTPGAYRAHDQ